MRLPRNAILLLLGLMILGAAMAAWGGQVWTKCHITCRCLQDNQVGNFKFVLPLDVTHDIGFQADKVCKVQGHRVCLEGCNSYKFSYTYQVTSP